MIVEACPRCGANLVSFALTCDPPVPKKYCPCCGWSWTGEPEEIVDLCQCDIFYKMRLNNMNYDLEAAIIHLINRDISVLY